MLFIALYIKIMISLRLQNILMRSNDKSKNKVIFSIVVQYCVTLVFFFNKN